MVVDVKSEGRGVLILERWSRGGKLEMWGGSVVQQKFPVLGRPTGGEGLSGCDVYGMNRAIEGCCGRSRSIHSTLLAINQ